ncbi:FIMAH domain-containing protein [Paenibacillus sp. UNC451MF]|uniref:FIMAH domain-containing protein n=1 Tax=Paenibacillus sp. UNC451MF TaxID=1449063 RepID=UPI00056C3DCA|nr:metallophosphoesterase [Paenibacillus sp. UNC451MF]
MRSIMSLVIIISLVISPLTIVPANAEATQESASGSRMPPILITEIVPDTTNVGSSDGYEFVELYNPLDRAISLKDYNVVLRYPSGSQSDVTWTPEPRNISITPGGTLVVWLGNQATVSKTAADFNANFGSSLVENVNLVKVMTSGLINERMRTLVVTSNTGEDIVKASYNDGSFDVASNKGIFYRYPEQGSNEMIKLGARTNPATPGTVASAQVPSSLLHLDDSTPPVIMNRTQITEAQPSDPIQLVAEASDYIGIRTMTMYYKSAEQASYTQVNLTRDKNDGLFRYTVPLLTTLSSESLQYYFTASDGMNETTSDTYVIPVINRIDSKPRLNVEEGSILSGQSSIKATMNSVSPNQLSLYVDGTVVHNTYLSMEKPSYFVFEVEGIDPTFKNAVTIGTEVIQLLDYAISTYTTVVVPIPPKKLMDGSNTITFRAGSKKSPFLTTPAENLDDFNLRNVRLVTSTGTVIRDPQYSNPSLVFDMGDGGRYLPAVDFTFALTPGLMSSLTYQWDTAIIPDGVHQVKATYTGSPHEEAVASVLIDNTKPVITSSIEEGREYRGSFSIDANASDSGSGIKSVTVTLDDRVITVPYAASSAALTAGPHALHIQAADKAGNVSEKSIYFSKAEPLEGTIQLLSPVDGAESVTVPSKLAVTVASSVYESLNMDFFKGSKFTAANRTNVKAYKQAYATEPPKLRVPEGEQELLADEIAPIAGKDGQYLVQDSITGFPYVRFEVQLDGSGAIDKNDQVEIQWKGKSLAGRKVTMYAWNYSSSQWQPVDSFIPLGEEDFILKGAVSEEYVRNLKLNVLIQDQIPPRDSYDYTMVWLSDTQFYTELWPDYYESQIQWIKDNKDALNIQYVFHTGDVVNEMNQPFEWERADQYMKVLEQSGIPYGVLAGNHDVENIDQGTIDYSKFSRYFGEQRFLDQSQYGESYQDNRGHYDLISAGGKDFLFLYMGWDIGEKEFSWMNKVLADHPNRTTFIAVHDYLNPNGTRSSVGEQMFQRVVVPNKSVVAVLSGHYTGSSVKIDPLDDNGDGTPDRAVVQMLNDYQALREGGSGYMKLLHFDSERDQITIQSYSPAKDDYNYYDTPETGWTEELTMNLDLAPQEKRVATDYFEVKVYSDDRIESVSGVPIGQTAEVTWQDLSLGNTQQWYVRAQDSYGDELRSDMWSFRSANLASPSHLRASEVTGTSAKLQWDPVIAKDGGTVSYEVYRDNSRMNTVTGSVYEVAGLTPGTKYEFYVVAADQHGNRSQPSVKLTITTEVNLSMLQQLLQRFIDSGELKGPLAKQAAERMQQIQHHYDKGSKDQAVRFLQMLLQKLNLPALQTHITAHAKAELLAAGNELLQAWNRQ